MSDLAGRLRYLKRHNGWTTAEMAYRSGLPKRSLDKYMLREGASLPGFDALKAMATGFGISIDWLVFGPRTPNEYIRLLVENSTHEIALDAFESLVREGIKDERPIYYNGEVLGMSPEWWASCIADKAAEIAADLSNKGATADTLRHRKSDRDEQLLEYMKDRLERIGTDQFTSK